MEHAKDYCKYEPAKIDESDILTITEPNGKEIQVVLVEGMLMSVPFLTKGFIPDPRENLKRSRTMECRTDDVYICAYMKSGTHWVWEITSMLLKGKAEYIKSPKESAMLEFHWPEEFDNIPSPRVLNSHLKFNLLPEQVKHDKARIIFIQRNPKDVCVSQYCHIQTIMDIGSFSDFVNIFLTRGFKQSWFDYTLQWEATLREYKGKKILCLYFEDMKKDPQSQIQKIADFLDVRCSESMCNEIADKCHFTNLKKANEEYKESEHGKPNPEMSDKWRSMYRKGELGDWKNWLTVAENEEFDAVYAEKMKHSKFTYMFE